jgi:hypothetical protein
MDETLKKEVLEACGRSMADMLLGTERRMNDDAERRFKNFELTMLEKVNALVEGRLNELSASARELADRMAQGGAIALAETRALVGRGSESRPFETLHPAAQRLAKVLRKLDQGPRPTLSEDQLELVHAAAEQLGSYRAGRELNRTDVGLFKDALQVIAPQSGPAWARFTTRRARGGSSGRDHGRNT